MKKTILALFAILAFATTTKAQETAYNDYNKWSFDLSAGVTKPARPVASGYFTNTPSFYTVDFGTRYMFNDKAGLRLGLGMNSFEADDESLPFKSRLYRAQLEGVINAGNILGFREWTNTFNLLVHGGGGYSKLVPSEPTDVDFSDGDQMLHLTVGVTPQIKLTDRIALFGDVSLFGNIRQDLTFDGTTGRGTKRGVDGYYVNASAGISIYIGKNEEHADWYSRENNMANDLDSIQGRLSKLEDDLQDDDRDGVPNYIDREPNTVSGVTVDTKGVAVDQNENGIPDELESSLDARYARKGEMSGSSSGGDIIKKLIDDGYVNVYFQFNSTQPEVYSYESINYLIKYMKENPSANADLIGYADEIGNTQYNQNLSERRAQKVKDILVASGVESGRLTVTGNGEDTSVDKNSSPARQLVRRVTFKLK